LPKALDSLAAIESKAALRDVSDPSQIEDAIKKNPSNPVLQLLEVAYRAASDTSQVTQKLFDEIEPLAKDVNYASATRRELEQYRGGLKIAEDNARGLILRFQGLLKDEQEKIEVSAKTLRVDSGTVRALLTGVEKRQAQTTDFNTRMLSARADLYHAWCGSRYYD
jgi:hypothetical protein